MSARAFCSAAGAWGGVLLAAGLLLKACFLSPGILTFWERGGELATLEEEVRGLVLENRRLVEEVLRLREDTQYIGFIAEKKLGMVPADSQMFLFEE